MKNKITTRNPRDYIKCMYLLLGFTVCMFTILSFFLPKSLAFSLAFAIPFSIFFIFFFFILPWRFFNFWVSEIVVWGGLRKVKKGINSETVVFVPKNQIFSPTCWLNPNYDVDLLFLIKYLKNNNIDFSICRDRDLEKLDQIMEDKKIKNLYLFGHGKTHGFSLGKGNVINYCRYSDDKYNKDFIFPIHCKLGRGKCITEYCNSIKNMKECSHFSGMITSFDIVKYYINTILNHEKSKIRHNFKRFLMWALYGIIPIISFLLWIGVLYYAEIFNLFQNL